VSEARRGAWVKLGQVVESVGWVEALVCYDILSLKISYRALTGRV